MNEQEIEDKVAEARSLLDNIMSIANELSQEGFKLTISIERLTHSNPCAVIQNGSLQFIKEIRY